MANAPARELSCANAYGGESHGRTFISAACKDEIRASPFRSALRMLRSIHLDTARPTDSHVRFTIERMPPSQMGVSVTQNPSSLESTGPDTNLSASTHFLSER